LFAIIFVIPQNVNAKSISADLSADKVKVGGQVQIESATENVKYKSSDTTIAYVDENGTVTGKKAGTVKIKVQKDGYTTATLSLKVVKAARKPASLPVAPGEVALKNEALTQDESGNYIYSAQIKNTAKSGKIKKIICTYFINDGTETVRLEAESIAAGETSETVSCAGDSSGELSAMELVSIELYTGKALYVYDAKTLAGKLKWGVADTTAPVFSGWIKGKSVYNGCVLKVCYTDRKDTYDFLDNISAADDRDKNVEITVDDSEINWKKEGVYKVYYTAVDKAGNKAKTWAKVQVLKKGTAETMADNILSSITKSSWSDEKKLRAIYKYIKGRTSYVGQGMHGNYRKVAVHGLQYQSGDCVTYYSISRLLITRAGIPNIMICRYPTTYGRHFWNLVYVRGGWYHFDTCPRSKDGYFCLQTDAQLRKYSTGYTFKFKDSLYPARATKVISRDP
jgi:hypothetical protein